jgi:hypothetical protein
VCPVVPGRLTLRTSSSSPSLSLSAAQELNANFRQIIFPEALRCLLKEEPTLEAMLAELEQLVEQASDGLDLQGLVEGLQAGLHATSIGLDRDAQARCLHITRWGGGGVCVCVCHHGVQQRFGEAGTA